LKAIRALFRVLCFITYFSGLYYIIYLLRRRHPVILMYHSVNDRSYPYIYPDNIVSVENFERQIAYLASRRRVISLPELIGYVRGGGRLPADTVAITFDDGYYDFYSKAYPILKKYNIPCTLFLISGILDSGGMKWEDYLAFLINNSRVDDLMIDIDGRIRVYNLRSHEGRVECIRDLNSILLDMDEDERGRMISELELQVGCSKPSERVMLTWSEVKILSMDSLVSFGCHTHSHRSLKTISLKEIEEEVSICKGKVESLTGRRCSIFSYPIGKRKDFDQSIKEILRRLGFEAACTTIPGAISRDTDLYELRRISVPDDSSYIFKCALIGLTLQRG